MSTANIIRKAQADPGHGDADDREKIPLDEIRIDGGTQLRDEIDEDVKHEYADRMNDGDNFPPVVVFFDGEFYWLADGFHRYHAANYANEKSVSCFVYEGKLRDAKLYSAGANADHGLRRTIEHKRRAVELVLADEEWSDKSGVTIARKCKVSHTYVNKLRKKLEERDGDADSTCNVAGSDAKRIGRDGKARRPPKKKTPKRPAAPDVSTSGTEALQDAEKGDEGADTPESPEGGWEPREALDVCNKIDVLIGKAVREWQLLAKMVLVSDQKDVAEIEKGLGIAIDTAFKLGKKLKRRCK